MKLRYIEKKEPKVKEAIRQTDRQTDTFRRPLSYSYFLFLLRKKKEREKEGSQGSVPVDHFRALAWDRSGL